MRKQYPEISIVVGENGKHNPAIAEVCAKVGAKYIQLPFDSGVCVARNKLIKHVETKYVLIGDDDFFYDKNARVGSMLDFLNGHGEFDLIGGRTSLYGIVQNYQGYIEKFPDHFITTPINPDTHEFSDDSTSGLRYCAADLTFNYFLGRTQAIRNVPWDESIKVAYEHYSWFYDFKVAGGRVAFSPDPVVMHKPKHIQREIEASPDRHDYMAFRNRKSDKERFFKKYNLAYTIAMNGTKTYAPNHLFERRRNDTKYVDFCVTTFMRQSALRRLMISIAEFYPMANVYIADQSKELDREFYKKLRSELYDLGLVKRPSVEHLPFDCGLSAARNHLVTTTPNPLKLILDDDMVFSEETDIGKLVKVMEGDNRAGIVGGLVRQLGSDVHFEFTLEKVGDMLLQKPDTGNWKSHAGVRYKKTGCVLNFALMKRDVFSRTQWDPSLKVTEHMDFYYRFKDIPFNVLYVPEVVIEHPPAEKVPGYKELRQRAEYQVKMMKKHGLKKIRYLNGQVVELVGESLKRYKEYAKG
jgi:GT2 family glycosyltransferase